MFKTLKSTLFGLLLLALSPAVIAQGTCPAIVESALEAADELCDGTGRNQACYGHFAIEAVPGEGNRSFSGPYLLIKEEHMGTDVCYREYYNGKVIGSAEFPIDPAESIILPDVDEDGNQCPSWDADSPDMDGANTFTITVYVNRAQGGPVWLRMLP